ncbi:MAG: hypothetical protein LUE14_05650 [Clostridiales bacterium]|nr:hypothetical protein [Clostridiales bacterium]
MQDEDDIFGVDENKASNIPKACKIVRKKLTKRARDKIKDFIRDLEFRESSPELISVIGQCKQPIMVSALAQNMTRKQQPDYTAEEKNLCAALQPFSKNMESDLSILGNYDEVTAIFNEVVRDKERILEKRAQSFVPNAKEELKNLLLSCKEKSEKRIHILEKNDHAQLLEQKKNIESQVSKIKADMAEVFGELDVRLETEKTEAVRELREARKDYLTIRERSGTRTTMDYYTKGILFWKRKIYYPREEHYSYCNVSDVIENLSQYAIEASNKVGEVFTDALQIREIRRKLLTVVIDNFDMGSEKYDSSIFQLLVEESVRAIEFPIIDLDISDTMSGIAGKFKGEITSTDQKNELSTALSTAISRIYGELCQKMVSSVHEFKKELKLVEQQVRDGLLNDILEEFEKLMDQCADKEKEIAAYKEYVHILDRELTERIR